jgi:hypothetical protein
MKTFDSLGSDVGTYTNPPTTVDYAGTLRIYVVGYVTRSLPSKELGTAGDYVYTVQVRSLLRPCQTTFAGVYPHDSVGKLSTRKLNGKCS